MRSLGNRIFQLCAGRADDLERADGYEGAHLCKPPAEAKEAADALAAEALAIAEYSNRSSRLLTQLAVEPSLYQLGKTKVFFRQQALEALKDRTCDVFDDFLKQCAGDARTQPGDTPRSAIERLAESDVEAYMNAQFVAARLRGKRFVAIPGDVRHAEDSLRRYKQCVADAAAAKKARNLPEDFFARELDLCEQMIHLLPTKIHHVRTTGGVLEDF